MTVTLVTDARTFRLFHGAGFPYEDSSRPAPAQLVHYGTWVQLHMKLFLIYDGFPLVRATEAMAIHGL